MSFSPPLSYGIAAGALQGYLESGDQYLIKAFPNAVLIAVADGVGHGQEAAYAAKQAMRVLRESQNKSLIDLLNACHKELKKTRGAAVFAALIQSNYQVSWLGIGNVAAIHWRREAEDKSKIEEFLSQGGVVGLELPSLRISQFMACPGDTLIFATDGISNQFVSIAPMTYALPQTIADHIFKRFRNPNDDALVLVTRWTNSEMEI